MCLSLPPHRPPSSLPHARGSSTLPPPSLVRVGARLGALLPAPRAQQPSACARAPGAELCRTDKKDEANLHRRHARHLHQERRDVENQHGARDLARRATTREGELATRRPGRAAVSAVSRRAARRNKPSAAVAVEASTPRRRACFVPCHFGLTPARASGRSSLRACGSLKAVCPGRDRGDVRAASSCSDEPRRLRTSPSPEAMKPADSGTRGVRSSCLEARASRALAPQAQSGSGVPQEYGMLCARTALGRRAGDSVAISGRRRHQVLLHGRSHRPRRRRRRRDVGPATHPLPLPVHEHEAVAPAVHVHVGHL